VAELFSEDGKFFNAEMVSAGMAYHYQQYSGNCPHKEAIASVISHWLSEQLGDIG
jgi:endonuclease YncB( thermonuclease family)